MFNFKDSRSDHSFISQHWKKILTMGLTMTLSLNATNQLDTSKNNQFNNSAEQTANFIMDQKNNYFAQDIKNNIDQDSIHQNIQQSTVYILAYNESKNGNFTVDSGSGTIIQNSATSQSNGYNIILTAGHVVGMGGMTKNQDGHIEYEQSNPNFCNNYKCIAFDSSGHILGRLSLMSTPSPSTATSLQNKITNDVAVMKILPYDGRYQEIKGVKLASELSSNMTRASMKKEYKINDQTTINIGADHGLSGGGIFNQKGEIMGVLSFTQYLHTLPKDIHSQLNIMADLAVNTMYWKLSRDSNKKELDKADIKQNNIKMLANEEFRGNEKIALPDESFFASLGDKNILNVMGEASKNIRIISQYKDNESVSVYGYPQTAPISYQTHIDNNIVLNKKPESLKL